jgi:ATP adenylyltransferase
MEYIEKRDSPEECLFCRLAQTPGEDVGNHVLLRGARALALLNRFPYTNGHLMVAPFRHTAGLTDLDDDELHEVSRMVALATGWIRDAYGPDGYNIGLNLGSAGGAGIPGHVHWHVVPRWSGDTNFMTVVGEVRVVPEAMDATYARLRAAIRKLEGA